MHWAIKKKLTQKYIKYSKDKNVAQNCLVKLQNIIKNDNIKYIKVDKKYNFVFYLKIYH